MEKIYRIFVSSTFEDLREERAEVQKSLLKLKCLPVGMELFPSTDDETWDFIKRQIEDSDYYILIIAGRYGSLASDGIGFTEKEYDYAREIKKPTLAFVHGDRNKIEAGKTELDPDKRQKLESFITKVRAGPLAQAFTNPHDLSAQVLVSMVDLRDRKPAVGFVRADQMVDARKYADLLEENARLRSSLTLLQEKESKFLGWDNAVSITIETHSNVGDKSKSSTHAIEITMGKIFSIVADAIISEPHIDDSRMMRKVSESAFSRGEEFTSYMENDDFDKIKKKLYARQLVTFESHLQRGAHPMFDHHQHFWHLTEYAREQFGLFMEE